MINLLKHQSGPIKTRMQSALALCLAVALVLPSQAFANNPQNYLTNAKRELNKIPADARCTSSPQCVTLIQELQQRHTEFETSLNSAASSLTVAPAGENETDDAVKARHRDAARTVRGLADTMDARLKQIRDKINGMRNNADAGFKAIFLEREAPYQDVMERYEAVVASYHTTANGLDNVATTYGERGARLRSLANEGRATTNANERSLASEGTSAGFTAAGIAVGGLLVAGGTYFVGKELIRDASSEFDKKIDKASQVIDATVDRNLDKIEARTKVILEDAKKTANEFIDAQIKRIKAEAKGLTKEALEALREEILDIYDDLIAKAKADGDTALLDKLEKGREEILKYFLGEISLDDLGSSASSSGVGDFEADSSSALLPTDATDAKLVPLTGILANYKAAGQTGAALTNACRASGANLLGKTIASVTSAELAKINAICSQ